MKLLLCVTVLFIISVYTFISCKKDDTAPTNHLPALTLLNSPPVAQAGVDTSITLASCGELVEFYLDGKASKDPEGKALHYYWTILSGPNRAQIQNRSFVRTLVQNVVPGEYAFELQVSDSKGLTGKDTIRVSVKGTPKEYDFDLTAMGTFTFSDNAQDLYYCYYAGVCTYFDFTSIQAAGSFTPLGYFIVSLSESADTAAGKYASHSDIQIYQNNINNMSLVGTSTVNFKKVYQQGGGAFEGSITIKDGSARRCQESVFDNLPPLKISGILDIATKRATLTITGKAYF